MYRSSFTLQTTAPLHNLTVKCNTFKHRFPNLHGDITCTIPESANQSEIDQVFIMEPGDVNDDGEGNLIYNYSIVIRQPSPVDENNTINSNTRGTSTGGGGYASAVGGNVPGKITAATWTINDIQLCSSGFLPVFCGDNINPVEMKQFYLYGWDCTSIIYINDTLDTPYTGNIYTDTPSPTSTSKLYTKNGTEIYHILSSAGASMGDWYPSDGITVNGNTISFTCNE